MWAVLWMLGLWTKADAATAFGNFTVIEQWACEKEMPL